MVVRGGASGWGGGFFVWPFSPNLLPTCLGPRNKMDHPAYSLKRFESVPMVLYIILYIDRFYIALFSALEQTHCARM